MIRHFRLPIAAVVLLLALVLPAAAHAGTYQVKSCYYLPGQGWVGNGSWSADVPGSYATAYTGCPGEGIMSRMTGGPGTAPYGSAARHVLAAPPGTRIVRFSASVKMLESRGWYAGIADGAFPRWFWCGTGSCHTFDQYLNIDVPLDTSRLFTQVVCGASTCPRSALYGFFTMRDVVVTIADETPPSVAITGGSVTRGGWLTGDQDVHFVASDNTGIREVTVAVDGVVRSIQSGRCSDVRSRPCEDESGAFGLPAQVFRGDGKHTVTVRAIDGGTNPASTERIVWVDRTPPAQLSDLSLEGSDEWRPQNRFSLNWSNPPQDAASIAAVRYSICPVRVATAGPQSCGGGVRRGRDIRSLKDLQVPAEGEWRISLWLEDEAGNQDPERSVTLAGLRFDSTAPTLSFLDESSDDPARIRVAAGDQPAGIAQAQIELRRQGEESWRALPANVDASGFSAVVEDETLPDGVYDLRARAVDRAGNERSTSSHRDGRPASMTLPVKVPTRLVVGKRQRVRAEGSRGRRYRHILVVRPKSSYGRTIPLSGRLTTPGGNPLAAVNVEVSERVKVAGSEWRPIAAVRTSTAGRFRFKALRGPGRELRFRYAGSATISARSTIVDLRVTAATSFSVSRHEVVNGEEVTFHGRLGGRPFPDTGKLIQLQAYARGHWLTFATPRASAGTGRWSHRYRFAATRGRVRYRFRARIPREASYPYGDGTSSRVHVIVNGL